MTVQTGGWTTLHNGESAANVVIGGSLGGQSFNREAAAGLPAVPGTGTPGSFTWPRGSRPASIDISLLKCDDTVTMLWVTFDAPDAATADTWLQGAAGTAVDTQRWIALCTQSDTVTESGDGKTHFEFTAPLSNMYYILDAADAGAILLVEAS